MTKQLTNDHQDNFVASEASDKTAATSVGDESSLCSSIDTADGSSLPLFKPSFHCPVKMVAFSDVQVHEHSLRLGDNPSVSSGLPVALGEPQNTYQYDVDVYEQFERKSNTGKQAERLSKERRERIIRNSHTRSSITRVQKQIKEIKESRQESMAKAAYKAPKFIQWMRERRSKRTWLSGSSR